MRLSHARRAISARFDDPNLVSCAGPVPVMALAERCGLRSLLLDTLTLTGEGTANPAAKITALVGGISPGRTRSPTWTYCATAGWVGCSTRSGSTFGTFLRRGMMLVRADSAFYGYDVIHTCRRAGVRFSVTARLTASVTRAITSIDEQAWTPIRYPNAIWEDDDQRWVSDAEIAFTALTAFIGRRRSEHVTAWLIVRRVRRLNPRHIPGGQSEVFAVHRYHAVFTDSSEPMLIAKATLRNHAIVEQVISELKNGPLAHLPSARFARNSAWLACAMIAHNLTRDAGALGRRPKRQGTRRDPAHSADQHPARVAHPAHQQTFHLPRDRPWEPGLDELFRRALHDPLPTAS